MSLPKFSNVHIRRDTALNQIISSIAMEEAALSKIICAEGEKLKYAIGLLSKEKCPPAPEVLCKLLELNKSIKDTLEIVSHSQMLLNTKLKNVLDAKSKERSRICPRPEPPVIKYPCGGQTISEARPVISGTARPGNTILICIGSRCIKTTADIQGKFCAEFPIRLSPGTHILTATQTNYCGRNSCETSSSFCIPGRECICGNPRFYV